MRQDFLENPIVVKDIPKECPFDLFLLENNEKQISEICDFLQDDNKKLMLVNGFKGAGKSLVVDFVSTCFNSGVLTLRYNCLETTILDDMLLNFFEAFRVFTVQGKLVPPRIKTENFIQKINSYFNSITRPVVIILHSFEAVLKSNKQEILSFIKHLSALSNVKIIITARNFQFEDFENVDFARVTVLALSQAIFEKYLKANGIKNIGLISNELYKHTKGYYNYVNLSARIMNLRGYSLVQFLEVFSKSLMAFPDFILREALALVDPVSAHLFRLLTVMRVPIHVNLLKSLHLFDEERVFFFVTNSVLSVDGECLYLQDCFREIIDHQIPENVQVKLHSACIDLYNIQLPLKPLERDLKLSRQTMRNEIEYHSLFIPKKPVLNLKNVQVIDVNPAVEVVSETVPVAVENNIPEKEESKEEKINKISFIIEDEAILDGIADSIKDFVTEKIEQTQIVEKSSNLNLTQIINLAKQEEQKYNYKYVISLYQNALTKKDDEHFYFFLPTIYVKLAEAYKHLSQWYEALEYYTQAQDFYYNASNLTKVSEIKLEIANIYYIIYKHDNAKYILTELDNNPNLSNEFHIKVNLALAKLANKLDDEYDCYKKSLQLVDSDVEKSITAQLYYKFAGVCDEKNDIKSAVLYYKKCIALDTNPHSNKYLSRSLANLAELYDEAGQTKSAVKYYKESMKIDTLMKNYNGLFNSAMHMSEINSSIDTNVSLEFLNKALEYAKILNEPFYIVRANLEIGDFYMLRKDLEQAYKYFISAYDVAKHSFSKDNLDKVSARIENLERRMKEEDFKILQERYGK